MKKLGAVAPELAKPKKQRLPEDRRGQATIEDDDE
jgi:hypothetical protein